MNLYISNYLRVVHKKTLLTGRVYDCLTVMLNYLGEILSIISELTPVEL